MRRTAGSGRRGAVIIETALVAPLLLVIVFGIVEMAFLKKDDAALASLVRAGGRTAASALADHREQSHQPSEFCAAPACSVANAPELADAAATAIVHSDGRLSKDAIHELWVYKANAKGYPGTADSTGFGSCVDACVVYRWSPERQTFEYVSGSWRADDIHACVDGQDSVGVYLKATHEFHTGLFSRGVDITDHAVFSFDALGPTSCSARLGGGADTVRADAVG